ncbi:nucleotidyltransferase family protein [Alteromonas lipolytica]|uniref:Nucleotidyltransferase n=1 Tax=Alteromonas lipolytica TaxID=1856405 RepID=A0A1E8FD57_9ALTE|nr:nucleotidyltransferase family protein [Alteromonas lipolytica]OFI33864.1 hypothetical protein BFC17_20055 [Alteromonas lipolytica]GGF67678.1 hypothetical protein GCM10011338_19880 [Alteromonas lipolytica]
MTEEIENRFLNLTELEVLLLSTIIDSSKTSSNFEDLLKYKNDYFKNGLLPLLYNQYDSNLDNVEKSLAKKIKQEALLVETLTLNAISTIFSQIEVEEIVIILMKGWCLKRTLYTESYLRPAADIDLLVKHSDYEKTKEIFLKNGFFIANGWQPELSKFQICLRKKLYDNNYIEVDLHYKFCPDPKVSRAVDFDLLRKHSVLVDYGPFKLFAFDRPIALLHSIIHLALHIKNKENYKLIWFVDIYMLINTMSTKEKDVFISLINQTGFTSVTANFLNNCEHYLPMKSLEMMSRRMNSSHSKRFDYITRHESHTFFKIKKYYFLYKLGGWKSIFQVLFPSVKHMQKKYGDFPRYLLIFFYIKRILFGLFR